MEKLTKYTSFLVGIFLVLILLFIMGDIFKVAFDQIDLNFLLSSPSSAGRKGGIFPIIISTLLILIISLMIVIPIGLASALYLSEYSQSERVGIKILRKSIEILASVPSIIFGLFGNAFFSIYLGMGFSLLSGGFTLAIMSLPLFIYTVESGLRSVPNNYRFVANSLGLSKLTIIRSVIIPYAMPSILVGIILSVGRALAETAALIFTSGYVDRMPESIFDSGRTLSVHIYDLTMNVPGGDSNAYKTAFVLIAIIVLTNSFFNLVLTNWHRKRIFT